ncbi:SusE domain-containing protein [Hymenobacter sp. BT507]|uniref:SusE domain-containing protein n=1 Tax=Hymenobacter citatus TaxID=2763506 RepID=A0ABR7MGH7_9BACT|nr:SusE domain-containing protein [Hymenobacter citatus]MBC6610053.1 SusE domain-containing protein [Hymenobacter citatus]
MKTRPIFLFLFLFLTGIFSACNDDDNALDETITPVSNLISPVNNAFIRLDPPSNAAVTFEWGQARAADGTVVLYELVFDKEGGDFSKPVYSIASGTNGLDNRLVLSHGDLNRIADIAGIKSQQQGKLIWTVNASKGLNVQKGTETRMMTLERPAGFSTLPPTLYLTGSGTEAGANASQAIQFKSISAGVFELYTRLSAGDVKLIDQTSGTSTTYAIDGNKLVEGNQGTSPTTTPKVYRIRLDFNNAAATLTEIESVGLWFAPQSKILVTLPYVGKGVWKVENTPIEFFQESWGRDERYKFRFTEKNAAGATTQQFYGSSNSDNQRATASTPASYYYLMPVTAASYDYTYKFQTEADKKSVDVTVRMQPDGPYTHQVVIR